MALEAVWMLTALMILATVCIGVFKSILIDNVLYSRGPRDFLLDRLARYGDHFTMSLMGRTYTVISSPETIKFVLSTAHASFPGVFPVQFCQLLSPEKFQGEWHPQLRKIMVSAAAGEGLQKLVPFVSSLAEKTFKSWENQGVVDSVEELEKFVFSVGMHLVWKDVKPGSEEMDQIWNEISHVGEGLVALPINFPGFSFHKAMKAKQVLVSRIQREVSRRRKAGIQQDDVLNALMSIKDVEIPDYDICCTAMGIMFAAYASSGGLISFVLKYLDDYPEVRQRVQERLEQCKMTRFWKRVVQKSGLIVPTCRYGLEEQECFRQKMIEDKSLTWFKPKSSMPYTLQVINEVLRIEFLTISPRQANKDVDYNGLVFRKGSYVWASGTSLHHDPKYHPKPSEFDPSRFAETPKPNAFLPFGQGPHLCPGSELALTETMFIIHHLVTYYSWIKCGPNERVTQYPIRKLEGFPIRLVKRSMT